MEILATIIVSLKIALTATCIAMCVGLLAAFLTIGKRNLWTLIVEFFICIPLFFPPTVLGFYMLIFLGREGSFGKVFSQFFNTSIIFTPTAAVAAASAAALPIVYKSVKCFMECVDPEVVNAAKTDGANSFQVMCFIQIPLASKGIIVAGLLAFLRAMGEFGISSMIAGNIPGRTQTMSLAIWDAVMSGKMLDAHLLSGLLCVFSLLTILIVRYIGDAPEKT